MHILKDLKRITSNIDDKDLVDSFILFVFIIFILFWGPEAIVYIASFFK